MERDSKAGIRFRLSPWILTAVSEAAKAKKKTIALKIGKNQLGQQKKSCDIVLPSKRCSKKHCILEVNDSEIILRDESTNGTYVNDVNYKRSRCILEHNDIIGFGYGTKAIGRTENSDIFIYRVQFTDYRNDEVIPLSDDEEGTETPVVDDVVENVPDFDDGGFDNQNAANEYVPDPVPYPISPPANPSPVYSSESGANETPLSGYETDENNESTLIDEVSPPDIHSLMQRANDEANFDVKSSIKTEVCWFAHEYEKGIYRPPPTLMETIDLLDEDEVEDDVTPVKRRRSDDDFYANFFNDQQPKTEEPKKKKEQKDKFLPLREQWNQKVAEEEERKKRLKGKVMDVTCSKSQRLLQDFLSPSDLVMGRMSIPSTSQQQPKRRTSFDIEEVEMRIAQQQEKEAEGPKLKTSQPTLTDIFSQVITSITQWDFEWFKNGEKIPDLLQLDIGTVEIGFETLESYQKTFTALLRLEVYTILLDEYTRKKQQRARHYFTDLRTWTKAEYDDERNEYKCLIQETETSDKHPLQLAPGDIIKITHFSRGRGSIFLGYITSVQTKKTVGGKYEWKFVFEAGKAPANQRIDAETKHFSIQKLGNISHHLQCFLAILQLGESPLHTIILQPSSQLPDGDALEQELQEYSKQTKQEFHRKVEKLESDCSISFCGGDMKIHLIEGGPGTGKSRIITDLLKRIVGANFKMFKKVLVCGVSNATVDKHAHNILAYKDGIAASHLIRFGKLSNCSKSVKSIGVDHLSVEVEKFKKDKLIVFVTISSALDLLSVSGLKFDLCIVDDATLCNEVQLLPLFKFGFDVMVLAGDNRLNTSTVVSEQCRKFGFNGSLFSRFIDAYKGQKPYMRLHVQTRMRGDICKWINHRFYGDQLKTKQSVLISNSPFKAYTVFQANTVAEVDFMRKFLDFCMEIEKEQDNDNSYGIVCGNEETRKKLNDIVRKNRDFKRIEVSGRDCFQGDEKTIIVIAAIKPTDGFTLLSTVGNFKIALTRATQSLIVFANFENVKCESIKPHLDSLKRDAQHRKRFFDLKGNFTKTIVKEALEDE